MPQRPNLPQLPCVNYYEPAPPPVLIEPVRNQIHHPPGQEEVHRPGSTLDLCAVEPSYGLVVFPVSKVYSGLEDLGGGQRDVIQLVRQFESYLGERTRLHLGDLPAQLGVLAGAAVEPG